MVIPDWVELLLILDYDGVVQTPALPDFRDFEHLPRLEAVLRDFPGVGVIVGSTHRIGVALPYLRSVYSPDIQERVLGATPDLIEGRADGGRYLEIQACLRACNWLGRPWLSLDDEWHLYPGECPELILTSKYGGFDKYAEERLRERLTAILSGVARGRTP
jgi:hypothetical protein